MYVYFLINHAFIIFVYVQKINSTYSVIDWLLMKNVKKYIHIYTFDADICES